MAIIFPEEGTLRLPPGRRVKYVPNNKSFGAFMKSEQIRDAVAGVAAEIAAIATGAAPPPSANTDPGKVGSSYKVEREAGLLMVGGNLRVMVRVEGTGDGVERAEFGTRGGNRYRTLATAGSRLGDWKPID